MTTYGEYLQRREALENLLPSDRDLADKDLPDFIKVEATKLKYLVLGYLATLADEGWDDD